MTAYPKPGELCVVCNEPVEAGDAEEADLFQGTWVHPGSCADTYDRPENVKARAAAEREAERAYWSAGPA